MDASTLVKLTRGSIGMSRARELIPGLYEAWSVAGVNSRARRCMWFAQILHESGGLKWTTELADGSAYNGRTDLGNTHPGDGPRFKGRGFIQLTGRNNYTAFSKWCYRRKMVPNDHYFIDHPEAVANDRFAWVSAAYYWLGNHDHGYRSLNAAADKWDLTAATRMVNGGLNGLDSRRWYLDRAKSVGNEIMTAIGPNDPNWSDVMTKEQLQTLIDDRLRAFAQGNNTLHKAHPAIYGNKGKGALNRIYNLEHPTPTK
jgi:putative chitinase